MAISDQEFDEFEKDVQSLREAILRFGKRWRIDQIELECSPEQAAKIHAILDSMNGDINTLGD